MDHYLTHQGLERKKEKTNKLKQLHNSKYSLDIMTSTQPTSTSESFLYVSFISERKDQHIVASDDAGRLPSCFLLLYYLHFMSLCLFFSHHSPGSAVNLKIGLLLFPLGRNCRCVCALRSPVLSKNHFGFATHHLYSFVERQVESSHEERTHSKTETFTRYYTFTLMP